MIAFRPMGDVAFDTMVASRWEDPAVRDRHAAACAALGARIVVPVAVVIEMAATQDVSRSAARLAAVGHMRKHHRAVIGADIGELLKAEWASPQTKVLRCPDGPIAALSSRIFNGERPPEVDGYFKKDRTFGFDQTSREHFALSGVVLTEENAHDEVAKLFACMFDGSAFAWTRILGGRAQRQRARKGPKRFPALWTFAALITLHECVATFPNEVRKVFPDYVFRKNHRNDMADLWITSSAAHAEVLVTDDAATGARLNYVREHVPAVRARAETSAAFLSRAGV